MEYIVGGIFSIVFLLLYVRLTRKRESTQPPTNEVWIEREIEQPTVVKEAIVARRASAPHREGLGWFMASTPGPFVGFNVSIEDSPSMNRIGFTYEGEITAARVGEIETVQERWYLCDTCVYDREGYLVERTVTASRKFVGTHAGVCYACGCDNSLVPEGMADGRACAHCQTIL